MNPDVCATINAGGRGTRLGGVDKALLTVAGRTVLEGQLEVLRPLFREIVLVASQTDRYARFGVRVVPDRHPPCGPLGGLAAALASTEAARVLLVACDMPFLRADVLGLVADAGGRADVAIPVVGGRPEPLLACYARSCLAPIEQALREGRFKMTGFFERVRVVEIPEARLRAIDPDLRFLYNVNAPGDLESANAGRPPAG